MNLWTKMNCSYLLKQIISTKLKPKYNNCHIWGGSKMILKINEFSEIRKHLIWYNVKIYMTCIRRNLKQWLEKDLEVDTLGTMFIFIAEYSIPVSNANIFIFRGGFFWTLKPCSHWVVRVFHLQKCSKQVRCGLHSVKVRLIYRTPQVSQQSRLQGEWTALVAHKFAALSKSLFTSLFSK